MFVNGAWVAINGFVRNVKVRLMSTFTALGNKNGDTGKLR